MEALTFLKLWSPASATLKEYQASGGNSHAIEVPNVLLDSESELVDDGDDSFFELELTLSDFDNKRNNYKNDNKFQKDNNNEEKLHCSSKNAGHSGELKISKPSTSSSDVLSKRKILPIEPTSSKPQSPIALLKSAPKLRVSIFKKSKSMATLKTEETDSIRKHEKQEHNKFFTVKFKIEEAPNLSKFTRACSLRNTISTDDSSSSSSYDTTSKRFSKSKGVIQKYLKLIKPLYVKVSKKNDKMRFSGQLTEASPAASPAALPVQSPMKQGNIPAGFRAVSRHLGKSKSASATVSSPARRDDSLLLQHDGIQSAILHCKKSFNSSRDSCSFSRSTSSSSSQGTLSYLSSKDSSLFPRFSSDSSCEEIISSGRRSSEEGI